MAHFVFGDYIPTIHQLVEFGNSLETEGSYEITLEEKTSEHFIVTINGNKVGCYCSDEDIQVVYQIIDQKGNGEQARIDLCTLIEEWATKESDGHDCSTTVDEGDMMLYLKNKEKYYITKTQDAHKSKSK